MSERVQKLWDKRVKAGHATLNMPALARRDEPFMSCFQADPGCSFVSQDIVSLEPSVTAHFSQDKRYRWATMEGIGKEPYYDGTILMIDDIYLMVASQLPPTSGKIREAWNAGLFTTWTVDSEHVKKELKKVRSFAKVCALGLGYGMGARKLQTTCLEAGTSLTFSEAKAVVAAYWRLFSGLRAFADTLQWRCEADGYLINPFWYRITPEPHKAFNAYIQSAASGVLDLYCLELFNHRELQFVGIIHDEVIFQCSDEYIKALPEWTDKACMALNTALNWTVPIRFGTVISKTFAEFK